MTVIHHMEAAAVRAERRYLDASYATLTVPRLETPPPVSVATRPVVFHIDPPTCSHAGIYALRVMDSAADFIANPGDFRCASCNGLLDAPPYMKGTL